MMMIILQKNRREKKNETTEVNKIKNMCLLSEY